MCQKWFVPAPILLSISFEIGVTTVATFNLANWYSIEMFDGIGFHWGQLVKTFQKVKVNWNWKFGVRPLFRSFESPFWMSTSFIWQSSEQKIDLQSIQPFNSWQLPQSLSRAKTVHLSFNQSQFQLLWPPLCICDRMVDARMHTEAICSQSFHKFQLKFPLPFSETVKLFSNFSKIARMH